MVAMPDRTSRRPRGLTVLALLLAWLSVGAITLAIVRPTPTPDLAWTWYQLAAGLYALTAIPAAVGMWRRNSWAPTAFSILSVAALLAGVLPARTIPMPFSSRWTFAWLVRLVGAVFLVWLGRYVRRSIQPAA